MDKTNIQNQQHPQQTLIETRVIGIEGMTCDKCVTKVHKALTAVPGVESVQVNQKEAHAQVTFDTVQTNVPALHDALLKSGYKPTANA